MFFFFLFFCFFNSNAILLTNMSTQAFSVCMLYRLTLCLTLTLFATIFPSSVFIILLFSSLSFFCFFSSSLLLIFFSSFITFFFYSFILLFFFICFLAGGKGYSLEQLSLELTDDARLAKGPYFILIYDLSP